jgi:hypothetical protein
MSMLGMSGFLEYGSIVEYLVSNAPLVHQRPHHEVTYWPADAAGGTVELYRKRPHQRALKQGFTRALRPSGSP